MILQVRITIICRYVHAWKKDTVHSYYICKYMYHVVQVYVNVPCFAICFCTAADLFFNTKFFVSISSKILRHIQHILPAGNTLRIIWPNSPMSQPPTEIAKSYPVSTYTNYIFSTDVTRCIMICLPKPSLQTKIPIRNGEVEKPTCFC